MKANSLDDEADGRLIRRFAEGRDERAFARLVQRHGALVAGVCARLLHNRADAEDAFQAVFLVLARKANALRRRSSVAAWLHQVAVRVCLNERRAGRRRQLQLQEVAQRTREPARMDRLQELKRVIDEELAALPERVREVLILCDLEGHTQADVARRLAVPVGTVSSRLTRGRAAMRKRLTRHGITIATGGVSFVLAKCAEAAPKVSPELIHTTTHNAHIFVAGTDAMKSTLEIKINTLAEGVLRTMLISQWKTVACLVALLATSLFGGAVGPSMMGSVTAAELRIDIDSNSTVQPGWESLPVSRGDTGGDGQATYPFAFGIDGAVTVEVDAKGERLRPELPGQPLSEMFRDFVFTGVTADFAPIRVTISDLAPGPYTITSYHADFDVDSGSLELMTGRRTQFDITAIDANGTTTVISDAVWTTAGASYQVEADGTNPIVLEILGDDPDKFTRLNGLVIAKVPEPSGILLGCLTLIGAIATRRFW